MSEFPERTWLWRDQYHYLNTSPSKVGNKVSVEYVRADLYDTVTAERDAAVSIGKELMERLQWYVNEDDVRDEQGNEYWIEGRNEAMNLLARAKELLK